MKGSERGEEWVYRISLMDLKGRSLRAGRVNVGGKEGKRSTIEEHHDVWI